MLIRSQDRMYIANLNNMEQICIASSLLDNLFDDEDDIYYIRIDYITEHSNILGSYQTKERAIEVLNEICEKYVDANNFSIHYGFVENTIYNMPEE